MITFLTGGSGCGKSTLAEKLIQSLPNENRVYIATMQVYDSESEARVARHRAQRANFGFTTLERPKNLSELALPENAIALLEDLPNLLANEMFSDGDPDRIADDLTSLAKRCQHLIIVSNDVFADGVVYPPSTDAYLKALAALNRFAASLADTAAEVVYSIPVVLKGTLLCG